MLRATLTARGRPLASSLDGVLGFLDLGRASIVRTFAALRTPAMHREWGASMANGTQALGWERDPHCSASTAADRHVFTPLRTRPLAEEDTLTGGQLPGWLPWARAYLERLAGLQLDWDSYGGRSPGRGLLSAALCLLPEVCGPRTPRPSITPMSSGHMHLEWHVGGIDLEVEVVTSTRLEVVFEDRVTGDEWEGSLDYDLSSLTRYVGLLGARLAA
jgi:hypothetical protein